MWSQMSVDPGGGGGLDEAASDHVNRSSSFLFDSLYDSPLLGAPEKEEESPSRQQCRRRSQRLANQEAEEQEAIQWGESSFNLSEWGDSVLVGEHFLDKQVGFGGKEPEAKRDESPRRNVDPDLSEQPQSECDPGPTAAAPTAQSAHVSKEPRVSDTGQKNPCDGDLGGRDEGGTASEKEEKEEKTAAFLSDRTMLKQVQDPPASGLHCSPGLQEILDRWPSMSDTWSNTSALVANDGPGLTDPPQPLGQDGGQQAVAERPGSAGDLIPPTQQTLPVTPRIKLTTSCVRSPVPAQPLSRSTPSASARCPDPRPKRSRDLSRAFADDKEAGVEAEPESVQDGAPSPSPRTPPPPEAETSDTDEGFTLQLSQDAALCSSNSGTFSIIDVASDRRLFSTFISEWKTQDRYSIALACERREPEEVTGGKQTRGERHF